MYSIKESSIRFFHKDIVKILCFVSVFLIVLNPYFKLGRPGVMLGFVWAFISVISLYAFRDLKRNALIFGFFIFVGLWGYVMSTLNNIPQLNHLLAIISFIVVYFAGRGLYFVFKAIGWTEKNLLAIVWLALTFNYLLILVEVTFPALRLWIESLMIPAGGNIDYAKGFRLRGIASAGGAGYSILICFYAAITIYLAEVYKYRWYIVYLFLAIGVCSTLFIGRTGLFFLPIIILTYSLFYLPSKLREPKKLIAPVLTLVILLSSLIYFQDSIQKFAADNVSPRFARWSVQTIMQGPASILNDRSSRRLVTEHWPVLPKGAKESLMGVGFYGGSEFTPWTDPGFNRTFLSVGYVFGIAFYLLLFYLYLNHARKNYFLFLSMFLVLLVSELKEPLLFTGNAARIYIFYLCFIEMKESEKS
jgi:hypothetical protein